MYLHPVPVSYDLQHDKFVVTWPWGSHSFSSAETAEMAEALRNYAIERSRRVAKDNSISHTQLISIRDLIERSPVIAKRYVPGSSGKIEPPSLDSLLDDADLSMYFNEELHV